MANLGDYAMCFTVIAVMSGCGAASSDPTATIPQAPALSADPSSTAQILTLTPRAADELRKMRTRGKLKTDAIVRIDVVDGNFFRLKNGGDKRYRYTMLLDDDPKEPEKYLSMQSEGLTIQIPKTSAHLLNGTQVIWIELGNRGGFRFMNPNQMSEDETQVVSPGGPTSEAEPTPESPETPAAPESPPPQPAENTGRNTGGNTNNKPTQGPTPLEP